MHWWWLKCYLNYFTSEAFISFSCFFYSALFCEAGFGVSDFVCWVPNDTNNVFDEVTGVFALIGPAWPKDITGWIELGTSKFSSSSVWACYFCFCLSIRVKWSTICEFNKPFIYSTFLFSVGTFSIFLVVDLPEFTSSIIVSWFFISSFTGSNFLIPFPSLFLFPYALSWTVVFPIIDDALVY